MKAFVHFIDSISEWCGKVAQFLCVLLVVLVVLQVTLRYVFNAPQLWAFDLILIFGAGMASFAIGYTQLYGGHVSVDIVSARMPPRARGLLNVLGHIIAFFPMMCLITYIAVDETIEAYVTAERFDVSGWYPPATPLYAAIAFGLMVLILQNVAQFIRDLHLLIKGESYD